MIYACQMEPGNSEKTLLSTFNSEFECGSTGDVTAVSKSNVEPVSVTFILRTVKEMQLRILQATRILTRNFELLTEG